jgi:hypothetical protein
MAQQSEGPEDLDRDALAMEIDRRVRMLPAPAMQPIRAVRRAYSKRLRTAPGEAVVALAMALVDRQRWVAYELLGFDGAAQPPIPGRDR